LNYFFSEGILPVRAKISELWSKNISEILFTMSQNTPLINISGKILVRSYNIARSHCCQIPWTTEYPSSTITETDLIVFCIFFR
jgi:hypothetical protein